MVLADAKDVQAHLIGVFDLLDQVSQPVLRATARLLSSKAAAKLSIPICIRELDDQILVERARMADSESM